MSSTASGSGPQSRHETSYGVYNNQGYHASEGGKFTIKHQTTNYHYGSSSNPLEELEKQCSHSASFDSAARFDPPRCAESTRLRIIQTIEGWINSDGHTAVPSSVFWLYGGAGVGKSAVAQSLSDKFQENEQLAASFFFFRSDATRNNGDHLIPTLVSHLVHSFEGISPFVEDKIRRNRALFTKTYQTQTRELLIEPLLNLKSQGTLVTHPRLIVIDGLDECENPDVQCELLRVIARAIPHIPYPLRFFITSRPESHITRVFNHDPDLQVITVSKYNLSEDPDADMDIRKFLEKEFMEIRRVHCLGQHLPDAWPDQAVITSLVERSSGHFVYASTVIRYIQSPKHRPDNRLEVILRLRPPREGDQPYAQLDALYTHIFQGIEDQGHLEQVCLVLGILYFRSKRFGFVSELPPYRGTIEALLEMEAGDLVLLLDPILSLVAIDDQVSIFHKTLFDYLLDFTRGGHLPLDLPRVHKVVAEYMLKQRPAGLKGVSDLTIFKFFAYHCQFACLSDTLKHYLHSLEVPLPKYLMATFNPRDQNQLLLVWYFFRTLSREDFDSTPQVYKQYAAKWMDFLHSAFPEHTQLQISTVDWLKCWLKSQLRTRPLALESNTQNFITVAEVDDLKHELDSTLIRKLATFNPMDVGMDPVRLVALVQLEQNVFSACIKAIYSKKPNTILSSLVLGANFIHSYDLVILEKLSTLHVRSYARHDRSFCRFLDCSATFDDHRPRSRGLLSEIRFYIDGFVPRK